MILNSFRQINITVLIPGVLTFFFQDICAGQDFVLHTDEAGLRTVKATNGVAIADYDRDGDLDIYFVGRDSYKPADKRTWNRLFSNNGDGTFDDVTSASGLFVTENDTLYDHDGNGFKLGAFWGDYDNDGYADLFVTNYGPNQLFHNNGDYTFTDVSEVSGVTGGNTQLSTGAVWFDYDLDGDLDLYVANWKSFNELKSRANWMYENTNNGIFIDVSEQSGLADSGQTYSAIAFDANNDGHLDLYLANDFGDNRFYENQGNKTFIEKTAAYNLTDSFHGMGLAIADIDNNGYFDIYLTNATESTYTDEINALFLNNGSGSFFNGSESAGISLAGWGWGTAFLDIDNDIDEDLLVATGVYLPRFPNRLFENISPGEDVVFKDISSEAGLADSNAAHGLAVFDYDEDGDQDILISNVNYAPYLYVNDLPQGNWLDVTLQGSQTNRSAFGSVVEIEINGNTYKKYHNGVQFLAQNILPVHFGLNNSKVIDKLRIRWLSGQIDEFDSLFVNQNITIIEGGRLISNMKAIKNKPYIFPDIIYLNGNYPNPFNSSTMIKFTVNVPGLVELEIKNILGQTVAVLNKYYSSAGQKTILWDTDIDKAIKLSSGTYYYHLKLNDNVSKWGKMILLK